MTAYSEFRLRIERGTRKGLYRVEASGLAGNQSGAFKVPFKEEGLENFVLKVGQTRRGVRTLESPQYDAAKTFGGKLFSAVMSGPVGELYRSSYTMAQAAGQGTRVTLALTDVPELGEIPWEYLFDDPNFLAISESTPVVRYLDVARPPRPLQTGLPIRILGVVSAPTDYEVLDAEAEKTRLTSALKPLIDAGAVTIEWLEVATLGTLAKKLQPNTFHILHFIGHGGFDKSSGKGALLFEDDTNRGKAISGEQLATILHGKTTLRLVFLNSCEGARASIKDPFSGVASSLIEREIPAVIAMQFEITDRAAIIFAGEFYAMLAEGQPVDASVTQARLLVYADDNDVEWGTPVLFLRVADGRLFDIADASALPRVAKDELPPKVVGAPVDPEPAPKPQTEPGPGGEPDERSDVPIGVVAGGIVGGVAGAGGPVGGTLAGHDGPTSPEPTGAESSSGTPPTEPPSGGTPPSEPPVIVSPPIEPPTGGPPAPPTGGPPSGGPPSSGPPGDGGPPRDDSPPTGGGGGDGTTPIGPVGPPVVRTGPTTRALGVAAVAVVAVLAIVFLLAGGKFPWDHPTGSTGQASELPSGSPVVRPTPTATATLTAPPSETPPVVTPEPPTAPPVSPLHIAVEVVDRTGTNSKGIIEGVRLAVKDAGGKVHGVPVTVPDSLIFDDNASTATGTANIKKIVKDADVIGVVGPYNSSVATVQIPLSNKAGLLQCSPSATSEGLTRPEYGAEALRPDRPKDVNFTRTVTTNEIDPIGAAIFLLERLGPSRVYIFDNGVESAVTRAQRFQNAWEIRGGTVAGTDTLPPGVTDYSSIMTKMKSTGPDVVYFSGSSGSSPTAVRLLRSIREFGMAPTFMGSGEIFDGTTSKKNSFLNLATDFAGTGVYMTYPAAGDYKGRSDFEVHYADEYGHPPSLYAITGYACAQAILDALGRTDLSVDRGALRDAVRASALDSTHTYTSAMGDFRFDENGDTTLQIITVYDFPTGAKDWHPVTYLDVPDP